MTDDAISTSRAQRVIPFAKYMPGPWENGFLAYLAFSLVLFGRYPIFAWLSPFIYAAGLLHVRFHRLERRNRIWILGCCGVALAVQLGRFSVVSFDNPAGSTFWFDDMEYFKHSQAVADAWKQGWYPQLSLKGSGPYLSSLHTGYERILAILFILGGPKPWLGIALNVICAAILPMVVYFSSESLFIKDSQAQPWGTAVNSNSARISCLICACNPTLAYWTGFLLKDVVQMTLFMLAFVALLDFLLARRLIQGIGFLLLAGFVTIVRAYAGIALILAGITYAIAVVPRKVAVQAVAYLLLALAATSYVPAVGDFVAQLLNSLAAQIPPELHHISGIVKTMTSAIPRLILAPYAWVRIDGAKPLYALYPGMWYLYVVVYPLALAGLIWAVLKNHLLSAVPIACIVGSCFVFLINYGGDAPRQRLYLDQLVILYAGLGFSSRHRVAIAVTWYLFLFLFAAVQLLTLHQRH